MEPFCVCVCGKEQRVFLAYAFFFEASSDHECVRVMGSVAVMSISRFVSRFRCRGKARAGTKNREAFVPRGTTE